MGRAVVTLPPAHDVSMRKKKVKIKNEKVFLAMFNLLIV